jgi:hypothetical protein
MIKNAAKSKLVSGAFVIIASASSIGCAQRQPMMAIDLDHYQIDCSRKAEQIAFLQSQRSTRDERLYAGAINTVKPWTVYTDTNEYSQRYQINNGRVNWIINQKLMRLAYDCP